MATPFNMTGTLEFTASVDPVVDGVPFWQGSTNEAFWINNQTWNNVAGAVVGTTDSQTLTNKTLTSPTISGPTLSGTLTGTYTIGGTPTFPASVVTLTGSQTLTNKTITAPAITGGTLDNTTVTVDTVAGHTTANTGTVYGIAVTSGTIGPAALAANSVTSAALATGSVGGTALTTSAITLGYAPYTNSFSTAFTGPQAITGVTVTVPAGGRYVKVTGWCSSLYNNTSGNNAILTLWDGAVGTGTQISQCTSAAITANQQVPGICMAILTPTAGSHAYNIGLQAQSAGTATAVGNANYPLFILVEAI